MAKLCEICSGKHYAKNRCRKHYIFPSTKIQKHIAKPTKGIAKVSSKQAKLNRAYKVLRDQYMKDHPVCEARLPGCTYHATDLHHMNGRGLFLLDATTYKALCRSCHQRAEMNPNEAKALGLSGQRL